MDTTGSATEGDPLNRGEDGAETAATATELKKKSCEGVWGLSRLTHWRTAVFFFSLFLCLTIVFAFSFIIPCPVRPQYRVTWNRTFSDAGVWRSPLGGVLPFVGLTAFTSPPATATYDFLAIEDVSKDKVMDVLFVLKNTEGSRNSSCDAAGMKCYSILIVFNL